MDFLCQTENVFKNPSKSALNELFLERKYFKRNKKIPKDANLSKLSQDLRKYYDIRTEKVSALDPCWIQEKHSYYEYQPYYSEVSKEENEQFLQKNQLFLESIRYILERSYHQFWCLLLFEPRVRKVLDSFIENPLAWYEIKHLDEEYLNIYSEICDNVAKIYSRILTFNHSDIEYMSEDTVVRYLDQSLIITYPKIIHLCLLYSNTNRKLLDRIIDIFFNEKRKALYSKELKKIMNHALSVFDTIGGQICGFDDDVKVIPNYIRKKPSNFDPYWIEEATSYLLDTAANLNAFLAVCKVGVQVGLTMGIPYRLTYFYNRVYHELYTILKRKYSLPYDWSTIKTRIYDLIALGRSEFVAVYHIFVTDCIDNIVQHVGDEHQAEYVDQYFKLISSALEDEYFIFDYQNTNEIDIQFQMITDFYPDLDQTRTNYILECLATLPNLQEILKVKKEENQPPVTVKAVPSTSKQQIEPELPVVSTPSEKEIREMIQSILETLPHLGDGFVFKCLEHYDYDTAAAISAILDEALPQHLLDIPPDMILVPPEPEPEQPVLAYRGKKPGFTDAVQMLNDKSDIEATKKFILKKSTVSYDIYDDEYDDRDYIEEPRLYNRSAEPDEYKYMENRFEGYDLVSDPSESESDHEEVPQKGGRNQNATGKSNERENGRTNNAFCEDPALVRERREAQRKFYNNSKPRNHDVVGKPKGQGQDSAVIHNRDKKNAHKSSRANHNRKSGSQWKRNKGMLPS